MKCCIPEISWHNRDPVLSVDIQPKVNGDKTELMRLASGGTDSHVLIWYMAYNDSGSINLDLAADLTRHQRAVNAVKWSPNGELLASGDDESVIFIWKLKGESEPVNIVDGTNEQDKEIWITLKILRGHMEDVYDLSWCHNSQFLVSGSVDNTAMIWDIHKGKSQCILGDHKGFVQGVAWDPQNQYIATLSTDRYMRVFDIQTKKVVSRSGKCTLPVPESSEFSGKQMRIFHDDTLQTFFRRLCFSPDGKLLITPAGVTDFDGVNKPVHTSYIYSRYSLKQPSIVLPSPDQYTVAAKFCPVLFTLRPHSESNKPAVPLPYRMIFAIATKSSVYLYDTQQQVPFGLISNIHYTRLTDLTWSSDGRILIVSSTDGFCSLITFAEGELGEVYKDASSIIKIKQSDKVKSKSGKGGSSENKKDSSNKVENGNLKPSSDDKSVLKDVNSDKEKKEDVVVAKPIAIRRKPRTENEIKKSENNKKIEDEDKKMEVDDQPAANETTEKDIEMKAEEKSELNDTEQKTQSSSDKKLEPEPEKSENTLPTNFKQPEVQATDAAASKTSKKSDSVQKESSSCKETIVLIEDSVDATDIIKTSSQPEKKDDCEDDAKTAKPVCSSETSKKSQNESSSSKETIVLIEDSEDATNIIKTSSQPETEKKDDCEDDAKAAKPVCPNPEIILDKDIISSDNKFVSPEKKSKPLTPISVRRHPRNSPTTSSEDKKSKSSEGNKEKPALSKTPKSAKKATPIAVRKQPRYLTPNPVEKTAIGEEAMDAWPIDKLSTTVELQSSPDKKVIEVEKQDQSLNISRQDSHNMSGDRTEDIRLIYESSQDSQAIEKDLEKSGTDQETPGNKTPRRVELKTISTPKAKKKIFD